MYIVQLGICNLLNVYSHVIRVVQGVPINMKIK